MKRGALILMGLAAVIVLTGCGSGNEQPKTPKEASDHIYSEQLKTLDAAKDVSEVSRQLEEQKRKAVDDAK